MNNAGLTNNAGFITNPVIAFRAVAIAEALSWTGLLIGMVFKYLVVGDDIGVKIFGPIHGGLFLLYLVVTLMVRRQFAWSPATNVVALIASVPPLGTLVFERWASATGRLRLAGGDMVPTGRTADPDAG